jgi:hypothetical membrane protein
MPPVYRVRVHDTSRATQLGALVLLLRPTYVLTEVVTAAGTRGGYSFVADTVSKLGEVGTTDGYGSPRHAVMNGAFMGYGVALAGGALLMAKPLGPWVTCLLVVSGASSYAVGLAPLDQDASLHAMAATPLFVAQPLALALLGHRLKHEKPRLAKALLATGIVAAAGAVGFVLSGQESRVAGAVERVALWPVLGGLAAYAWSHLRGGAGAPAPSARRP